MVEYSIRCGRQAPSVDSSSYIFWVATAADDLVRPDCITHDERQAMDEVAMKLADNDER
jgi:hypothetical protein